MQAKHNHTLVVGGTGMLSEATLSLGAKSKSISVIARTYSSLERLAIKLSSPKTHYNPIQLDYKNSQLLEKAVHSAINKYGPIDMVIAWIHSVVPEAPFIVARLAGSQSQSVEYYHILSSAVENPEKRIDHTSTFKEIPNINYHRVILGYIIEADGSRWLSNREISQGVLSAISANQDSFTVGVVHPWSNRP